MKTKLRLLYNILIFIVFILISGCQPGEGKMDKKSILIVGLSAEYPPFEFQQQGKIVGFDIDLIQAIGKKLNKQIKIQDMSFHSLIGSLHSGKIDLAISGMTVTEERQKNVDFSRIYYQPSLALVTLKDHSFKTINDFSGKKIGVQLATTMEKWTKQHSAKYTNVSIISLDTNPPLVEKLKLGQIDAIVIETLQAIEFCKLNPQLTYHTLGSSGEGYGIALAKNSPSLAEINQALIALENEGILQQLQEKWGLKP